MSTSFARRFKVDVSVDGSTWVPFLGMQDFAPQETSVTTSVMDYDTNGFDSFEKPATGWSITITARRVVNTGVFDPGQELVRARQYQFGDANRIYIRYYDRNGAPEAFSGRALVSWTQTTTGAPDVETITAVFQGDGVLASIANPWSAVLVPVITSATPSAVVAAGLVRIQGAYFTGTIASTGVKFGSVSATSWDVISDSLIEAVMPSGTAGAANIVVTNGVGPSAAFSYTRGA